VISQRVQKQVNNIIQADCGSRITSTVKVGVHVHVHVLVLSLSLSNSCKTNLIQLAWLNIYHAHDNKPHALPSLQEEKLCMQGDCSHVSASESYRVFEKCKS